MYVDDLDVVVVRDTYVQWNLSIKDTAWAQLAVLYKEVS